MLTDFHTHLMAYFSTGVSLSVNNLRIAIEGFRSESADFLLTGITPDYVQTSLSIHKLSKWQHFSKLLVNLQLAVSVTKKALVQS